MKDKKGDLIERVKLLLVEIPKNIPTGKVLTVGDVPVAVTEQHYENFYFWQNLGLKNASLVHVDAHKDMDDYAKPMEPLDKKDYHKDLEIHNFICAAVQYGIVGSHVFWINPYHEEDDRIRAFELETAIRKLGHSPYNKVRWTKNYESQTNLEDMSKELEQGSGILILDIDLDAFSCCGRTPIGVQYNQYDYEKSIEETIEMLKKVKKPGLITITRSQSCFGVGSETYVNPQLVDKVENQTVDALVGLYGPKVLVSDHKSDKPTV